MHFSATYQLIENSSFGNLKPFLDKKHIPPCLCMSENVKSFTKSPRLTVPFLEQAFPSSNKQCSVFGNAVKNGNIS